MAEGQIRFSLDSDRFRAALSSLRSNNSNGYNLQHEFKTNGISLSQSLLIWSGESGNTWLLADFENEETYNIEEVDDTVENQRVEISELPNEAEQPTSLRDTEAILSHLQSVYEGTDRGFIDLLKRINLDEVDLEGLKRSNLSGAGFSFESVHQDLFTVHSMLREILASSHEWILNFPRGVARNVVNQQLQQFYENVQKIREFEISDDNPKQLHDNLLRKISSFCDSAKTSLRDIVAYLSSRKVMELRTEVDTTVAAVITQLEAATNRAAEINKANEERLAETEKRLVEKEEKLDQLILEAQNRLAEKPISQYKAIFANQAEQYRKGAQFWLKMAGGATAAFGITFVLLSNLLGSGGPELTGSLQNLFTKGFVLSPIYVWLNRSIKNYTAQKHLEVINTHRQNALETFDTFVAAAEGNRETRDSVLLSATDAIFDANQTGYLSTKGSSADSKSPVQQIIREFIPDKSSPKN